MEKPVTQVERILGGRPAQTANKLAEAFCASLQSLRSKYPINPNGQTDATLADVAAVFNPENGAIAGLKTALASVVVKQGTRYLALPGATIQPTQRFLDFFNRAAGVSDALWQSGPDPRF